MRLRPQELGYTQVETGVIHQYHHIGLPGNDIFLASLHIGKDGTQVQQHRDKSHICQLLIMLHHRSANCRHQVSPEKAEFRLWVFYFQSSHQMRRVQVTRSFTDNQIILHINCQLSIELKPRL